jgi:hypothetical protein
MNAFEMLVPKMFSIHCPFCRQATAVTHAPLRARSSEAAYRLPVEARFYFEAGQHGVWWMGVCNACQHPLLVRDHSIVLPTPRPAPVADSIPQPMRSDLVEAKQCLAAGAYKGAAVMARRALQGGAIAQGAPTGKRVSGKGYYTLAEQIAYLDEKRKITQQQREWAQAVRYVGNDGAHVEDDEPFDELAAVEAVDEKDANQVIDLTETLLEALYPPKSRDVTEQLAKRGKG